MDVEKLLARAKAGELARTEFEEVVRELRSGGRADSYTLLHIVGLAGDPRDEDLVAGYLRDDESKSMAGLALWILCELWGLCDKYLDTVSEFLAAPDWDSDGDAQQKAIHVAGEYLRKRHDKPLFFQLLELASEPTVPSLTHEDALRALARAMGDTWQEMPNAGDRTPVGSVWSNDILARAKRRVADD